HALSVCGGTGLAIELPPPAATRILEEHRDKERHLEVLTPKTQAPNHSPGLLAIQIEVEELPRLERLRDAVGEVESRHLIVRDFRIQPHHFRVIERVDERQHMADRRQVNIASWLVRLRLQRKTQIVPLRSHVLAQEVDRIAEPLYRFLWILGGIGLSPFAAAPEHIGLGSQLDAEVDGAHRPLQSVTANGRAVARERSVPKYGIAKPAGGRHRYAPPTAVERALEVRHDPRPLRWRRIARPE